MIFFKNLMRLCYLCIIPYFSNKIYYIDYETDEEDEDDDDLCHCKSCEIYRLFVKFTKQELKVYN